MVSATSTVAPWGAEPEASRRSLRLSSFTGLRRYNAFSNEVQLHFSICFSLRDFEANYSLARFAQRVAELQASRRASLASLRNQKRHGFGWGTVFVVNLLVVALFVGALSISPALAAGIVLAGVLANGAVLLSFVRWRSYQKRLMIQLQSSGPNDA